MRKLIWFVAMGLALGPAVAAERCTLARVIATKL